MSVKFLFISDAIFECNAKRYERNQCLSLGVLHINVGSWNEEGLGEEIWASEVSSELRDGSHTVVESLKRRVSLEDSLVVADTKKNLNYLVQLEVDH